MCFILKYTINDFILYFVFSEWRDITEESDKSSSTKFLLASLSLTNCFWLLFIYDCHRSWRLFIFSWVFSSKLFRLWSTKFLIPTISSSITFIWDWESDDLLIIHFLCFALMLLFFLLGFSFFGSWATNEFGSKFSNSNDLSVRLCFSNSWLWSIFESSWSLFSSNWLITW